jgi:hypothetical protein
MTEFWFDDEQFGKAALKKMGDVPENFHLYSAERVPVGMRVIGAVFRKAKSGKNKGKLCIMVDGTDRYMFVSPGEIEEQSK